MKYRVLLLFAALSAAGIFLDFFCGKDANLEVARRIYAGAETGSGPLYRNCAIGLEKAKSAAAALKRGDSAEFDRLMFQSYISFQSSNRTVAEPYLIEAVDLLAGAGEPKWLAEFIKLGNVSADFAICVYGCAGSPEIMGAFTYDFIEKKFKGTAARSWLIRARNDYRNISSEKAESDLLYAGIVFGLPQKNMELDKWKVFSRPLAAYLSKLKGREDLYEFFRVKSLSPDTLHEVRAGLFEYCEYAAKIFARCGDPAASVALLESLPDGRRKNLSIKRAIRDILKSSGGRGEIEKSEIGRILEE